MPTTTPRRPWGNQSPGPTVSGAMARPRARRGCGALLGKVRELLAPDGYFYTSTAVNAGVIDHICLFCSVAEVDELVTAAGSSLDDHIEIPHIGRTVEQCERERLPVSVSYALS